VNKFFGLIVLGLAVAVGFGSISGCPAKKTDTAKGGGGGGGGTGDKKITLTATDLSVPADKDKGTFDVTVKRDGGVTGDVALTYKDVPDGVTLKGGDTIAKDKDSVTVDVTIDKAKAKPGTTEITVMGAIGDVKADTKMKLKIAKAGEGTPAASLKLTVPGEIDAEIAKKMASFDVKVARENYAGDVKLTFKGWPTGVTVKDGDTIAAGKDSVTVNLTIDMATAKAGSSDVTVNAMGGDAKAEAKTKLVLK
jgi:hypothetical protein